ncbi:MAG: HlyD family efflux transporter periplasmic adaptor subunit [Bacteroidetes bacterium]|nr:HlyD family efflux transporter periplasmic adaptor subunit [Bacteroidota bacterium]
MSRNLTIRRSVIVGIAVLVVSFMIFKKMSGMKPQNHVISTFQTMNVLSRNVVNQDIPITITLSGKLVARNRIDLFSEVNGVLLSGDYREGVSYNQGQTIVRLDDSELRSSIQSQKSVLLNTLSQMLPDIQIDFPDDFAVWQQFHRDIVFDQPVPALPNVRSEKLKTFLSARNLYATYFNIKSQEARLSKFVIRAPFSGTLSSANINPGALVRAGQLLGTLIEPGTYELEASAGIDDLRFIKEGDKVVLKSNEMSGEWTGRILRINRSLDAATQSVKVYIGVSGKELREGQYMVANVEGITLKNVCRIPRQLLLPGDDLYFINGDTVLHKSKIDIAYRGIEDVYVRNLNENQVYLNQVVNSAYEGMIVKAIRNKAK